MVQVGQPPPKKRWPIHWVSGGPFWLQQITNISNICKISRFHHRLGMIGALRLNPTSLFYDPRFFSPFQTAGGLELDHQQTLAAYSGNRSDEKLEFQMQVVKFRNFSSKAQKKKRSIMLFFVDDFCFGRIFLVLGGFRCFRWVILFCGCTWCIYFMSRCWFHAWNLDGLWFFFGWFRTDDFFWGRVEATYSWHPRINV